MGGTVDNASFVLRPEVLGEGIERDFIKA